MTDWVTEDRSAWLRREWPARRTRGLVEMTRRFNARFGTRLSPGHIRLANREHRWGRSFATYLTLTRGQFRWLKRRIASAPRVEIADRFERRFGWRPTKGDLDTMVSRFGWQGAHSLFHWKKGHTHNNGRKWPVTEARKRTHYQRGNVPHNKRPMFAERWTRCDGKPVLQIKIPQRDPYNGCFGRWIRKAVWVWRQTNGEVPAGHCIVQLDGDPGNCDIENIECVPLGVRTRIGRIPAVNAETNRLRVRTAQLQYEAAKARREAA